MKVSLSTHLSLCALALTTACLSTKAAALAWAFDTDAPILGAAAASPSGNLYFGALDGNLYAVDNSGSPLWIFSEAQDWIEASPTITADNRLYVGSWDNFLYAIDRSDGSLIWSFETGNYLLGSAVVDAQGDIYFGSADGFVYALHPDGSLKWATVAEAEIEGSPAMGTDGTLYIGDTNGQLYALDSDSGELIWQFDLNVWYPDPQRDRSFHSSPALDTYGNIYIGCADHRLYAISPTGSLRWTFEAAEAIDSSPAIGPGGRIYVASRDGYLYALNTDGVLLWDLLVGDVFYCSPAIDQAGYIYIGSYAGDGISILSAISHEGEILWEFPWIGLNDSSPTLTADRRLYIGFHDGMLFSFDIAHKAALNPWPQFQRSQGKQGILPSYHFFGEPMHTDSNWFEFPSVSWTQLDSFPWLYIQALGWVYAVGSGNPDYWFYHPQTATYFYSTPWLNGWIYNTRTSQWSFLNPVYGLIGL